MKKILFFLFLMFLFSCEKEEQEQCWGCSTFIKKNYNEYTLGGQFIQSYTQWDMTETDIYCSIDGWTQNKIEREIEMNTDNKKIKCVSMPCQ